MKPPLVIYHSPCLDGFTAAWAMWLKHPDAEFVPGVYGQEPPDCTERDVYLLDFSYKRDVMERIVESAKTLTVLDHHKSAQKDLEGFQEDHDAHGIGGRSVTITFDMEKSGARLAWEFFHPSEPVPRLVLCVEDRDLWRFVIPESKAINAALFSYDYDFAVWNRLSASLEEPSRKLVDEGYAIDRKQMKDVRELVEKLRHYRTFRHSVMGERVCCANLPYTYASDAANLMSEGVPFAATYYQDSDGAFVFSLRSKEGGSDVSEVAARYGGGGHKHAAGFRVKSLEEL